MNALDNALRKALRDFYPRLSEMHLSDFKVRVLDEKAGTAAKARVMVESQDKTDSWRTIGVSETAFHGGMGVIWYHISASTGMLVFGFGFAHYYRKYGIQTIPE